MSSHGRQGKKDKRKGIKSILLKDVPAKNDFIFMRISHLFCVLKSLLLLRKLF